MNGLRVCAGWGLLVCMLSMLAGAAVEWQRLRLFKEGHILTEAGGMLSRERQPDIVDMNVFWQVPQYILVGMSEVHCSFKQKPSPNAEGLSDSTGVEY